MLKNKKEIENWLKKYNIENYSINEDLTVDVKDHVDLSFQSLKKIPIKFNVIEGFFYCSHNKLTSLEFCPKKINGDFNCNHNKLTSLEHCSKEINGSFECSYNILMSLKFSPLIINGRLNCSYNKLTSLEFCPHKINGDFILSNNKIEKEKIHLFNSKIKGNILSDFGETKDFLLLVQEQKIAYEKSIINKNLENHNNSQLTKKRL